MMFEVCFITSRIGTGISFSPIILLYKDTPENANFPEKKKFNKKESLLDF